MLGVDRAIAITILNRAWGVIAGPATLVFIVAYLTPIEQGFYFAFAGVLGLQIFFELGLGFVVMQTVSHLMAGQALKANEIIGDASAVGRLGRLLADLLRWYGLACAAFIVTVMLGGYWFLDRTPASAVVAWQQPWILVVPIFGLTILANACFSFLEGMGLVADVALARLSQALLGFLSLWVMFFLGFKLMALVAMHAVYLLISSVWILGRHGRLLRNLFEKRAPVGAIDWGREIWPFQWRIAVSWMAGYCGTQVITLILFAKLGAVEAGRFGLTLTALSAVASGATAWVSTKAPQFGRLVAVSRFDELDQLYQRAFRGAMIVGIFGSTLILAIVATLNALQFQMAERFLPLGALGALVVSTVVSVKVSAEASYLRAFRREPYMWLSVVIGLAQVVLAIFLASLSSVLWVAVGYACTSVVIGLFWAHSLFVRLRREYLTV
ncbi:MAG: hypothetical protein ACOH1I_08405 [Gallionellaceae bacterium]